MNTYQIRNLPQNNISENRFILLDGVEGDLKIVDSRWEISLDYYIILNSVIPDDFLAVNLLMPFIEIYNIPLVKKQHPTIPQWSSNANLCQVFNLHYFLEVSPNTLSSEIYDYNMYMKTNLLISQAAAQKYSEKIDVNESDYLIFSNETEKCSVQKNFKYSILNLVNSQRSLINNFENYTFNHLGEWYLNDAELLVDVGYDQMLNLTKSTQPNITLNTNNGIYINKIKHDFEYVLAGETKNRNFTVEQNNKFFVSQAYNVGFNDYSFYNMANNMLETGIKATDGARGIYIPLDAQGVYKIEIEYITKNNNYRYIKCAIPFNFLQSENLYNFVEITNNKIEGNVNNWFETFRGNSKEIHL